MNSIVCIGMAVMKKGQKQDYFNQQSILLTSLAHIVLCCQCEKYALLTEIIIVSVPFSPLPLLFISLKCLLFLIIISVVLTFTVLHT